MGRARTTAAAATTEKVKMPGVHGAVFFVVVFIARYEDASYVVTP
jgi:hypothetical protein